MIIIIKIFKRTLEINQYMDQNIQLCLTENTTNETMFDINNMMNYDVDEEDDDEYNQQLFNQNYLQYDDTFCMLVDYNENNTIKQLQRICSYYEIKLNKLTAKKADIINAILVYENNPTHKTRVIERKKMWFYMNELKKDKHMKQFVFWN
jgi:hypothetical protein